MTNAERYYLLENRQYVGYDHTLAVGPYQFSEAYTRPDWVERFAYQTGMLVWLVDQGYADNNTIDHPGAGYALPVDARPDTLTYPDGTSPSNRREPFDAVFGTHQLDTVCLHKQVAVKAKGKTTIETRTRRATTPPGPRGDVRRHRSRTRYYASTNPLNSVKVAGVGVKATVTAESGTDLTVHVTNPARSPDRLTQHAREGPRDTSRGPCGIRPRPVHVAVTRRKHRCGRIDTWTVSRSSSSAPSKSATSGSSGSGSPTCSAP